MSCIHMYLIQVYTYRYAILERRQEMFQTMGTLLFQQAATHYYKLYFGYLSFFIMSHAPHVVWLINLMMFH
jgi:hypothetical protein